MAMRFVWVKVFNYFFNVIYLKSNGSKDSFDFRGHSDGILLLLFVSKHCSEKLELKISAFGLKIYNKNL